MSYPVWKSRLVLAIAVALIPSALFAQEKKTKLEPGEFNPADEKVELFAAMAANQVEVKFIPRDAEQARLIVKNKTNKPLNVELPEAFASIPVLAQGGFGGAGGAGGAGGGGQAGGGGFGGGGGGQGGGQGGGGGGFFMNVAPEKAQEIKVAMLCLEHGKPDPRPAMPYTIKPLSAFSTDPALRELVKMFGRGQLSHASAQAAAWHISNKMSFEELAAKQIRRASGERYPYFSRQDIQAAMAIANAAKVQAQQNATTNGTNGSLSPDTAN